MSQGSIPGPSRSALFVSDLEEDIDCLLIKSVSYSNPDGMENVLGDRVGIQRCLDRVKKRFKITICDITKMSSRPGT